MRRGGNVKNRERKNLGGEKSNSSSTEIEESAWSKGPDESSKVTLDEAHDVKEKLFVERFVEGDAILLTNEDDPQEINVSRSLLPAGVKAGHWLAVTRDANGISYSIDMAETVNAKQRVQNLMDELVQ